MARGEIEPPAPSYAAPGRAKQRLNRKDARRGDDRAGGLLCLAAAGRCELARAYNPAIVPRRPEALPLLLSLAILAGSENRAGATIWSPPIDVGAVDDSGENSRRGMDYMHARYYRPGLGRFLSVDPALGNPANPQSWNRYSYVQNQPINFLDGTGAYREDFHRDLTLVLAIAAGYTPSAAFAIAAATQLPDEDGRSPTSISNLPGREGWHFVTGERLQNLKDIASMSHSSYDIGSFLHALQDSFSHAGYGPVTGHVGSAVSGALSGLASGGLYGAMLGAAQGGADAWSVDTTSSRPDQAFFAAQETYTELANLNGGNTSVSFSALEGNLRGYLGSDQHSALRKFYYDRLCQQVGCGGGGAAEK
jgi:RHS repeat-associated protein